MRIGIVAAAAQPETTAAILEEPLAPLGHLVRYEAPSVGDEAGLSALAQQLAADNCDRLIYDGTEHVAEHMLAHDPAPSFLVPGSKAMTQPDHFWLKFVRYGMLCLDRPLHERLQQLSCVTNCFQYFPEPDEQVVVRDPGAAVFVEDRQDDAVTLSLVTQLALELGVRRLHVVSQARDPAVHVVEDLQVEVLPYIPDEARHALFRFFTDHPVDRAGLGAAMAAGQVIVGHSSSLVAGYCADLMSGLIYLSYSTRPAFPGLDRKSLAGLSRSARRRATNGRRDWNVDGDRLRSIVMRDGRRWSTTDSSASFNRDIRKAAHLRAWHG